MYRIKRHCTSACNIVHMFKLINKLNSCYSFIWRYQTVRNSTKCHYKMKAAIRKVEGEDRIQISLQYILGNGKTRSFNLNRLRSEEVGKTFERLSANILKETNKKSRKRKQKDDTGAEDMPIVPIRLISSKGEELPKEMSNAEAFKDGATLFVDDKSYDVVVNGPKITSLKLPKTIMATFPIYPLIEWENCDMDSSSFEWLVKDTPRGGESEAACAEDPSEENVWRKIHSEFTFAPSNDLVGKVLKLVCIPRDALKKQGEMCISECTVSPAPGYCPFMLRHEITSSYAPEGSFRIVTYNLLADCYADSDHAREFLFPYCPKYAMDIDYRQQLFTSELVGYHSDIICLQECDRKVFLGQLLPILDTLGYGGVMKGKGTTAEGTAVFYRRAKFELLATHDIQISEHLLTAPTLQELYGKVCQSEGLRERVINRSTSLQVVLLQSKEDPTKRCLVATTHLYWHPKGPHVRMIQTAACLSYIEDLCTFYKSEDNIPTVIFAGDFNTEPVDGNKTLITQGVIHADHFEWMKCGENEYARNIELSHTLKLSSACGYPPFTNYTQGYKGCLDYIFVEEDRLGVEQVVPLPAEEELALYTAIPSVVCPSDHLAVVCDLKWK